MNIMKHVSRLVVMLFLLGGALILLGNQLKHNALINIGLIGLGLTAVIGGIEMIITERAEFRTGNWWTTAQGQVTRVERFYGLPARLWGIGFIISGMLIVAVTLAAWLSTGNVETFLTQFLSTPARWGALILITGILVSTHSLIRILAGSAMHSRGLYFVLHDFWERVLGVLYAVIGLGLVVLGVIVIIAPDSLPTLIHYLFDALAY